MSVKNSTSSSKLQHKNEMTEIQALEFPDWNGKKEWTRLVDPADFLAYMEAGLARATSSEDFYERRRVQRATSSFSLP